MTRVRRSVTRCIPTHAETHSPRQTEVLHLLAAGASTAQIQDTLQLSRETVRNHIRHLLHARRAARTPPM